MIHKKFVSKAIVLLAVLTVAASFPARLLAQGFDTKFSLTEISVVGAKSPPSFLKVSWSLTGLKPGARIEGYELNVSLSGNGQSEKVVQTPSPNSSSVSVGLLGISNEAREKMFGGPSRVSADVSLTVRVVHNGTRSSIGVRKQASFNPLPNQAAPAPTPKPRPDFEEIKDGLKKKERIVVRPVPRPKP